MLCLAQTSHYCKCQPHSHDPASPCLPWEMRLTKSTPALLDPSLSLPLVVLSGSCRCVAGGCGYRAVAVAVAAPFFVDFRRMGHRGSYRVSLAPRSRFVFEEATLPVTVGRVAGCTGSPWLGDHCLVRAGRVHTCSPVPRVLWTCHSRVNRGTRGKVLRGHSPPNSPVDGQQSSSCVASSLFAGSRTRKTSHRYDER